MNKKLIILGFLILVICILSKLVLVGLKNIKVDEFHPASVIFIVDSSASNQKALPGQVKYLKSLCSLLDPEDQIKILKTSQNAYLIYEWSPMDSASISKAVDAFTKLDVLNMLAGNETIIDDVDDGNEFNNLGGIWFSFNDVINEKKSSISFSSVTNKL